jgi:hypothetical protein
MTKHPPIQEQTATSVELDRLFEEHNFEETLSRCEKYTVEDLYYPTGHPAHPQTIHKYGEKYRLDGETVAVIFHYTHANKTIVRHIRMLRISNVRYTVAKQPPVHPQSR